MENVAHFKAAIAAIIAILTALWGGSAGWSCSLSFAWLLTFSPARRWRAAPASGHPRPPETASGTSAAASSWSLSAGVADLLIGTLIGHIPGVTLPFEYTVLLCPMVVVWYTLTELGSIVENAVALGAPVPQWLQKALAAAKDAVDKLGEDTDNANS